MATNNPINTPKITLAAPLTTIGAFPITITVTGPTNVTLPTSGTLISTIAGILPLSQGGTNADLSGQVSNGGIVWSNATQLQIMAGTPVANRVLLSGLSNQPSWSTAVYPATTIANQLLYSSAANTITGLATAANGVLVTSAGGVPSIGSTLPTAVQANITELGTIASVTGNFNMSGFNINNLADPLAAQDAATKHYVDISGGGFSVILACAAATTGALTSLFTHVDAGVGSTLTNAGAMAAFSVDGYAANLNDRILVKDQAVPAENGVYTVTTVGSGAVNWVLTRATDYDQAPAEIKPGNIVAVNNGTANAGTTWLQTATVATVDTDPILFSAYTFGPSTFLRVANNLSDVASQVTAYENIFPATSVVGAAQALANNHKYINTNGGLTTYTLPATSNVGDEIIIAGLSAGNWTIAQNAGQSIHVGSLTSTVGVGGSVSSNNQYDSIHLICIVTDNEFSSISVQGNLTVV